MVDAGTVSPWADSGDSGDGGDDDSDGTVDAGTVSPWDGDDSNDGGDDDSDGGGTVDIGTSTGSDLLDSYDDDDSDDSGSTTPDFTTTDSGGDDDDDDSDDVAGTVIDNDDAVTDYGTDDPYTSGGSVTGSSGVAEDIEEATGGTVDDAIDTWNEPEGGDTSDPADAGLGETVGDVRDRIEGLSREEKAALAAVALLAGASVIS